MSCEEKSEMSSLSAETRALFAVREMRYRLAEVERTRYAPISLIGMSCLHPGGASSNAEYWDLLVAGRDAIDDVGFK